MMSIYKILNPSPFGRGQGEGLNAPKPSPTLTQRGREKADVVISLFGQPRQKHNSTNKGQTTKVAALFNSAHRPLPTAHCFTAH